VAIGAGGLSLAVFGLWNDPSVLVENVTAARIGAGALSVALTGAILLLLGSSHPPSGATTMIVSLGFLQTPPEMAALMVGVAILTAVGWLFNRAAGVPVSIWSAGESQPTRKTGRRDVRVLRRRTLFAAHEGCPMF